MANGINCDVHKKRSSIRLLTNLTVLLAFFLLLVPQQSKAQEDLMVFPKRVVFENAQRYEKVSLTNIGKDTTSYQISMVNYRMNQDGTFKQVTEPDPGQRFATPFVRFFPRKVTLKPGETQVVRLQITGSSKLQTGEYRSHLYFRSSSSAPLVDDLTVDESAQKDTAHLAIRLRPIYGITIPVIIRKGTSVTQLTLSNISLSMKQDSVPYLHLSLNRTGNMSVHGNIGIQYEAPDGKVIPITEVKGISVYTPNAQREVIVKLPVNSLVNWKKGKLEINFTTLHNNKTTTLAEAKHNLS